MAKSQNPGKLSAEISVEVAEKARDAVYWTPGLSLAGLVEYALALEVERREQERGSPFPPRPEPLRSGRPLG